MTDKDRLVAIELRVGTVLPLSELTGDWSQDLLDRLFGGDSDVKDILELNACRQALEMPLSAEVTRFHVTGL